MGNYKGFHKQNKDIIKITPHVLETVSRQGNLKYLTLYLKLKKEFTSSHFHSYNSKPSWYPGNLQTFRNHINEMINLKWVKKSNKFLNGKEMKNGLILISMEEFNELNKPKIKQYNPNKPISIKNLSYEEVLSQLELKIIEINANKQLYEKFKHEVKEEVNLIPELSNYNLSNKSVNNVMKNVICSYQKNFMNDKSLHNIDLPISQTKIGGLFGGKAFKGKRVINMVNKKQLSNMIVKVKRVKEDKRKMCSFIVV